jgi:hypothetical protein
VEETIQFDEEIILLVRNCLQEGVNQAVNDKEGWFHEERGG